MVKLFLKIFLSIIVLMLLVFGGGMLFLSWGLDAGSEVALSGINLSELSDGTYTGKYKAGRWTNEVSVEVKDHQITEITLVKDVVFSKPEVTVELFDKVIANQTTTIDTIAGSTVTCKAYLKAIETALQQNN